MDEFDAITASGRFRKMEQDLYYGNGKPGICTRLEVIEGKLSGYGKIVDSLNESVIRLTAALNRFEGGAAVAKSGMTLAEKILTGIGVVGAFLISHLVWK